MVRSLSQSLRASQTLPTQTRHGPLLQVSPPGFLGARPPRPARPPPNAPTPVTAPRQLAGCHSYSHTPRALVRHSFVNMDFGEEGTAPRPVPHRTSTSYVEGGRLRVILSRAAEAAEAAALALDEFEEVQGAAVLPRVPASRVRVGVMEQVFSWPTASAPSPPASEPSPPADARGLQGLLHSVSTPALKGIRAGADATMEAAGLVGNMWERVVTSPGKTDMLARAEAAEQAKDTAEQAASAQLRLMAQAQAELVEAREALEAQRAAHAAREAQLVGRVQAERQARIEYIQNLALRRMLRQGVSRAWLAWRNHCLAALRSQRLLRAATTRLLKPKKAASLAHWRRDWELAAREAAASAWEVAALATVDRVRQETSAELASVREMSDARISAAFLAADQAAEEAVAVSKAEVEAERHRANLAEVAAARHAAEAEAARQVAAEAKTRVEALENRPLTRATSWAIPRKPRSKV